MKSTAFQPVLGLALGCAATTVLAQAFLPKKLIAAGAGLLKYKPATCGGQPCPGVVPFKLKLDVNLGRMGS